MLPVFTPEHVGGSGPPLLLIHGFTDTWHTWKLVLGRLERDFTVIAPTLPGHAGGPPLVDGRPALDQALELLTARIEADGGGPIAVCGNSLGGYLALKLAELGLASSVVALAPGAGWAPGDDELRDETLEQFETMDPLVRQAAPYAVQIAATAQGRRATTALLCGRTEDLPSEVVVSAILGAAGCSGCLQMVAEARSGGWPLDPGRLACPIRIVWGSADAILPWPRAAAGFRATMPQADWVVLDGVGHAPQLDVPLETAELIAGFAR